MPKPQKHWKQLKKCCDVGKRIVLDDLLDVPMATHLIQTDLILVECTMISRDLKRC